MPCNTRFPHDHHLELTYDFREVRELFGCYILDSLALEVTISETFDRTSDLFKRAQNCLELQKLRK